MNVQNKTAELIALGRQEVVLDEKRLEQNRARVLSRIAAAGLAATSVAVSGSAAAAASATAAGKAGVGGAAVGYALGSLSLTKLALMVAVVGGAVAGSYALARRTTSVPISVPTTFRPAVPTLAEATLRPVATLVEPAPSALPAESEANGSARATATSTPRAAPSSLSEHADLLRETRTALAAGNAARALKLLDSHREIAHGPLGPEWSAARILVLCRLGRSAEAKLLGQKFLKSQTSSPLAAQVRTSCGGHE